MSCPRCGFPTSSSPCTLCGQSDFDRYELARFDSEKEDRFDLTLIIKQKAITDEFHEYIQAENLCFAITSETEPRYYFYFPNSEDIHLEKCLLLSSNIGDKKLFVNGRFRPYTHELWLPLCDLLKLR